MKDEDLDLLPEEELFAALNRRYECYVFVASHDKAVIEGNQIVSMRFSYDGDRLRAMGLCQMLASKIAQEIRREMAQDDL